MARQRTVARNVESFSDRFDAIVASVAKVIQGKDDAIRLVLACLIAEGHVLIEDVPGVGKTSLAKALAASLDCSWGRIQFTPDLLPSDVTGVTVYNRASNTFQFRPGGIFANVVLADEINRASPKTQSALLEAMEEGQVTVDNHSYRLDAPFMVMATQNPIEHEGTYPLPESQLDRFLMRIQMGYPGRRAEIEILDRHGAVASTAVVDDLSAVATAREIQSMVGTAHAVHVATSLRGYIVDIADATRRHQALALGVSPRAALGLQRAARAWAAADGRDYVVPDDLKALAVPVLEHRLVLTPEAQLRGITRGEVVEEAVKSVPVPTGRNSGS